jgi:hypothetical protein
VARRYKEPLKARRLDAIRLAATRFFCPILALEDGKLSSYQAESAHTYDLFMAISLN